MMAREFPIVPYLRVIISDLAKISDVSTTIAEISINGALREPDKHLKGIVTAIKHEKSLLGK